jgi:outer membrane usher protein
VLDLNATPVDIAYQTRSAGFLNYALRSYGFQSLQAYQEIGISHQGDLALSTVYLSTDQRPVRGMTSYTVNERETLRRLTAGDSFVQTGPLGSSAFIGGMSLQRTFALNPYLVTSPRIGFSGTAETPSTLEVYVNGALVRREKVAPGTFDLQNLRAGGGAGTATYVLRDVFGQEQRISVPFYVSGSVLSKGLQEYTYAVGAVRGSIGQESWDYKLPAFFGRHRIGLDRNITFSAHSEVSKDVICGGPGATALTPIGQVELELSASHEFAAKEGFALHASYAYVSGMISAGVRGQFLTDDYAIASTPSRVEHIVRELSVFASVPIKHRASLGGSASLMDYRHGSRIGRVDLSAGAPVWRTLSVSLSVGAFSTNLERPRWSAMAGMAYVFPKQHAVSGSTFAGENGVVGALSASRSPAPAGYDYGYRFSAQVGEQRSVMGSAQYQTPYARFSAGYQVFDSQLGTSQSYGLEAAGAVVVVPKVGFFATLPVYDSFGVIRMPGVPNVRGYVNNIEAGRTNRKGNLVVPNVLSYYGNRFSVAPEDVPMRYRLDEPELTIGPPLRGVAVAEFSVAEPHYYRGSITLRRGDKSEVPQFGDLRLTTPDGERGSPLGQSGEFEIEGLTPGTYQAVVESPTGVCQFQLVATSSSETIVELGEIPCLAL